MCENKCESCSYRESSLGSGIHSSCNYPDIKENIKAEISNLAKTNFSEFQIQVKQIFNFTIGHKPDPKDWYAFPFDFDPSLIKGECKNHSNIKTPLYVLALQKWRYASDIVSIVSALIETKQVKNDTKLQAIIDEFNKPTKKTFKSKEANEEEKREMHLKSIEKFQKIIDMYSSESVISALKNKAA